MSRRDASAVVRSVLRFAVVSGVGLAIDFGIFLLLVRFGVGPVRANLVSATVAVSFVYFVSVSKVFSYRGRFLLPLFLAYLLYQAVGVSLASVAVGALARQWHAPGLAKLAVLPVTFSFNYIFMWLLTRTRNSDSTGMVSP